MQRRYHYEQAFENYLRTRRIPYVAVDEARKALLPDRTGSWESFVSQGGVGSLKSFDFVIYGADTNLLVECKGRKLARRRSGGATTRLENWVTQDDIDSLLRWEGLFGAGFEAVFVFVYWCDDLPPDALFEEIVTHDGRWYSLRAVRVREYAKVAKVRSPRWGTMNVPSRVFDEISGALAPPGPNPIGEDRRVGFSFVAAGRAELPPLPGIERLAALGV